MRWLPKFGKRKIGNQLEICRSITITVMFCLSWKQLKNNFFLQVQNLDLFKDGMTVPGLTLKYLLSTVKPGIYFTIIDSQNQDLHQMIEENITGGRSIIFLPLSRSGYNQNL